MNYYNILGINKDASADDIKKAYRKLASQHHPDKGGDTSKFQQIEEAYRILSDPSKRQEYDNPQQFTKFSFGNFGSGGFNMNGFDDTIFSHIFGQRAGNPFNARNNKPLFRTQITISLEDVYFGKSQIIKIQTPTEQKVINIEVPKGIVDGSQIRYDNVLDNATLLVEFKILPNLKFERKNMHDLYYNHAISILDLIIGTTLKVPTISGKEFEVNVPPKTQPNMQLRISGQGMPIHNTPHYGDQYVCLKPYIPDMIEDEIIQTILRYKK